MKTKKMIGLSLSLCIRDIIHGIYTVDDVVKIITGTCIKNMADYDYALNHSARGYCVNYWQANPGKGEAIFMQLLLAGKIDQPRLRDEPTPNLQNGHWLNMAPNIERLWGSPTANWIKGRN